MCLLGLCWASPRSPPPRPPRAGRTDLSLELQGASWSPRPSVRPCELLGTRPSSGGAGPGGLGPRPWALLSLDPSAGLELRCRGAVKEPRGWRRHVAWRLPAAGSCLGLNLPLPLPVSVSSGTHRRRACEGNTIDTHLGLGQRSDLPPQAR